MDQSISQHILQKQNGRNREEFIVESSRGLPYSALYTLLPEMHLYCTLSQEKYEQKLFHFGDFLSMLATLWQSCLSLFT